ncbi:Genome polyprotein [Talaromyces islandicus]|uniref:Genome polyprotein n=1 Tax=Talaromyces islandicus TaxID=28573 RepID=A0A0U1LJA6_TALIS|nr:Genome polyprotein [Talaromyces islandicus]
MSPALSSYPSSSLSQPLAPSYPYAFNPQYQPPLSSLSKLSLNPISDWSVTLRDGLPTPPSDMSGVAFNPQLAPSTYAANKQTQFPHFSKTSTARVPLANTVSNAAPNYLPPMAKDPNAMVIDSKTPKKNNDVASYLQIPPSINTSCNTLTEFAAQIACLFWFEKTSKLKAIEENMVQRYAIVPEAIPAAGFQKWVTTVLSTTQVSQNVILLALLFIYRLKKFNTGVRGKKGSEFRLMTIALMMGNKFLDDNTYTNKTWAEVSGIGVKEIHIMEVEFLSNVRYNLFVSKEEWTHWHSKLSCFADFFEKASRLPFENDLAPTTPVFQISPTLQPLSSGWKSLPASPSSKLPSPLVPNHLQPPQIWGDTSNGTNSYRAHTPPRHLPNISFPPYPRKRSSCEAEMDDHPSKRMAIPNNSYSSMSGVTTNISSAGCSVPVLPPVATGSTGSGSMPLGVPTLGVPVPRLPMSNSMSTNVVPATTSIPTAASQQLPLPNVRAMSTVFNPATTWSQPMPAATTAVTPQAMNPMALYNQTVSLPDPNRRQSPYPTVTPTGTASPATAYPIHTPQSHLSPTTYFLVNRNSPYRPVRAVNTLLIPPPSASLQQPRNLSMDQMHYQPLGKTATERRTGVLPYLHHDAWPQGPIAQPNFHNY